MAELHGKSADIDIGGIVVGAKNWTISHAGDVAEATDYSDNGIKTFISGGSGWTGTFEVNKSDAPPFLVSDPPHTAASFKESDTAGQVWIGDIIIQNIDSGAPMDDIVVYTYSFQGTGALTAPTA